MRERTPAAVLRALASGATHASTGPEIHGSELRRVSEDEVEVRIRCSESRRVTVVHDVVGKEYHEHGEIFEEAVWTLRPKARLGALRGDGAGGGEGLVESV